MKEVEQWTRAVSLRSSDEIIHCPGTGCPREANGHRLCFGFLGCRNINANSGTGFCISSEQKTSRNRERKREKEKERDMDRNIKTHHVFYPACSHTHTHI